MICSEMAFFGRFRQVSKDFFFFYFFKVEKMKGPGDQQILGRRQSFFHRPSTHCIVHHSLDAVPVST